MSGSAQNFRRRVASNLCGMSKPHSEITPFNAIPTANMNLAGFGFGAMFPS
jgi:hypothetical protein